jgi:thioester reductase-like protein
MVHVVTGFPGFIGRRLVRALLEQDEAARVVTLVQDSQADTARRLAGDRVEVLVGDITDRRLGLDDATYERLAGDVRKVWHLAAIYDLAVPKEAAQAVNVEGTGNVLDLCLAADGLERFMYFSTAYVAGDRTGVVYEHELSLGQGFKNHYESTKFQAELWVREEQHRVPTTIVRPAIVVGDSRTGETEKFDGPYYILRAISQAHRFGRPMPQFGRGQAAFNVVPVDYVVAASVAASADAACAGQTLHLVDPEPLSSKELVETLSQRYAGRAPKGRVPAALLQQTLRLRVMREAFAGTPRESIAYLNHPVRYDARRTVDLLRPHGLEPPRFTDYADTLVAFFRAHEDDPAFRPRGT